MGCYNIIHYSGWGLHILTDSLDRKTVVNPVHITLQQLHRRACGIRGRTTCCPLSRSSAAAVPLEQELPPPTFAVPCVGCRRSRVCEATVAVCLVWEASTTVGCRVVNVTPILYETVSDTRTNQRDINKTIITRRQTCFMRKCMC